MLLKPCPVSTDAFTYDLATGGYVGEISSTNGLGRVWDDSADQGLTLVFEDGRKVVFVVNITYQDTEGDVTHWVLVPAKDSEPYVHLTLYND